MLGTVLWSRVIGSRITGRGTRHAIPWLVVFKWRTILLIKHPPPSLPQHKWFCLCQKVTKYSSLWMLVWIDLSRKRSKFTHMLRHIHVLTRIHTLYTVKIKLSKGRCHFCQYCFQWRSWNMGNEVNVNPGFCLWWLLSMKVISSQHKQGEENQQKVYTLWKETRTTRRQVF